MSCDVLVGVGERDVVFALALQDAALAQQRVEAAHQLGVARRAWRGSRLIARSVKTTSNIGGSPTTCAGMPARFKSSPSAPHQRAAGREDPLVGAGPLQDLQRREAGGRGDRIAGQRADLHHEVLVADLALVEVRHDVGAAGDRRQREAAADRPCRGAEVGHDAVVFLGAAVGEAEAGHDLVEDQRHAVLLR